MVFRMTGNAIKDTGKSFVLQKKTAVCFAVGDTFKGWLSTWRLQSLAIELRKRLGVYGMIMMRCEVFENGHWEIVSVQNDL